MEPISIAPTPYCRQRGDCRELILSFIFFCFFLFSSFLFLSKLYSFLLSFSPLLSRCFPVFLFISNNTFFPITSFLFIYREYFPFFQFFFYCTSFCICLSPLEWARLHTFIFMTEATIFLEPSPVIKYIRLYWVGKK